MPLRPNLVSPGSGFSTAVTSGAAQHWPASRATCHGWSGRSIGRFGLGRHVEVARMCGSGGDFDSVTWPGYAGVLTASARGRFAACINQAPDVAAYAAAVAAAL